MKRSLIIILILINQGHAQKLDEQTKELLKNKRESFNIFCPSEINLSSPPTPFGNFNLDTKVVDDKISVSLTYTADFKNEKRKVGRLSADLTENDTFRLGNTKSGQSVEIRTQNINFKLTPSWTVEFSQPGPTEEDTKFKNSKCRVTQYP